MKKLIVPLMLCVATIGAANADWKKVTYSDNAEFYLDHATIRTNGQYKEAWVMANFKASQKTADGKPYLSQKTKSRFDCNGDRTNTLALVFYSENMGAGDIVWNKSFNDNDWNHNVPESVGAATARAVCGR